MVPGLAFIPLCLRRLGESRPAGTMLQRAISSGRSPFALTAATTTPNKHSAGLKFASISPLIALRRKTGSVFKRGTAASAPSRTRLSCSALDASAAENSGEKKRLVFLGTPEVWQTRRGGIGWHAFSCNEDSLAQAPSRACALHSTAIPVTFIFNPSSLLR